MSITAPTELPELAIGIEQYATSAGGRMHPALTAVLQPFFEGYNLGRVRLDVRPRDWLPFRVSAYTGRKTPTPAFAFRETIYCRRGWLHASAVSGGADFNFPSGWEALAHEVFHCYEHWQAGGMKAEYAKGVALSLLMKQVLWSHAVVPMERRAIAFAAGVRGTMESWPPEFWALCRQIRG